MRASLRADTRAKTCCAVSPKGSMILSASWYSRKRCSQAGNLRSRLPCMSVQLQQA